MGGTAGVPHFSVYTAPHFSVYTARPPALIFFQKRSARLFYLLLLGCRFAASIGSQRTPNCRTGPPPLRRDGNFHREIPPRGIRSSPPDGSFPEECPRLPKSVARSPPPSSAVLFSCVHTSGSFAPPSGSPSPKTRTRWPTPLRRKQTLSSGRSTRPDLGRGEKLSTGNCVCLHNCRGETAGGCCVEVSRGRRGVGEGGGSTIARHSSSSLPSPYCREMSCSMERGGRTRSTAPACCILRLHVAYFACMLHTAPACCMLRLHAAPAY